YEEDRHRGEDRVNVNESRCFVSIALGLTLVVLGFLSGCSAVEEAFQTDSSRLLAPEKVIKRPRTGSPINPIYTSVGPADIAQELPPNATFPTEADLAYTDTDYLIGPTDVLDISILDLFAEGLETVLRREVSASGFIDLPLLTEKIKAEGLTRVQLQEALVNAYRPDILRDPTISVTVAGARQNTFSILGAVNRPGQYSIVRKDMRLMEALANAGGIAQSNIRYVYVIRPQPAIRRTEEPTPPTEEPVITPEQLPELPPEAPPEAVPEVIPEELPEVLPEAPVEAIPEAIPEELPAEEPETAPVPVVPGPIDIEEALRELEMLTPGPAPATEPAAPAVPQTPEPSHQEEIEKRPVFEAPAVEETKEAEADKSYKWVYVDGEWVQVVRGEIAAVEPAAELVPEVPEEGPVDEDESDPFGWRKLDKSEQVRIIAIDLPKLNAGDPRMNVIVRINDIIRVPTLEVGEFYVNGEVLRPGAYALTGRRVTVKQAITAAGNLGPLAWPKNAILYRRVGDNQEQIYPLDIGAIFKGEQPDFFLKADDVLAVGSDIRAPFFAVVRNAFRMTYGFGFIYDRNFADPYPDNPNLDMDSKRFTRW
ncbi:MAG: polysaccharide biosynthesis/export family protein, partial [Planctomycetota bacterium]